MNLEKLKSLINLHPTETKINEFNKYDELFSDLDVAKARVFLNKKLGKDREVKMEADEFLRNIIINGV